MRSKEKVIVSALKDIVENIVLAQAFVADIPFQQFLKDTQKKYAVVRCLEIISEASRRLPEDLRKRHEHIPWTDIASAGNIYRHEYEYLEYLEVWNTVHLDLPPLMIVVEQELSSLPKIS